MARTPEHGDDEPHDGTREETIIPVVQEELDVHAQRVDTGRGVRVTRRVEERTATADEPLMAEDVEVERVPVNRPIAEPVGVRHEGDTPVIPVLEEVLVVEKRLILREEVRITRRRREFRAPQAVPLRREIAEVERIEEDGAPAASPGDAPLEGSPRAADTLLDDRRREQEALRRRLEHPGEES